MLWFKKKLPDHFNVGNAVGGEGPDPAPHEEPEDQQRAGGSQVSYPFLHTYRESSRFLKNILVSLYVHIKDLK